MSGHVEAGILRYFRGEVTRTAERDALFAHLESCADCRAAFDGESEAHRLLSGRAFGRVELASVLPAVEVPADRRRSPLSWAAGLAGLAAAAAALLVLWVPSLPPSMQPKGSGPGAVVHVICFDAAREVTHQLTQSGSCPAPGFLKVVYRGSASVPILSVVVMGPDGVRLHGRLAAPEPGALVPDYAALGVGEELRVIAIGAATETPLDVAKDAVPVLTVQGTP